MRLKEFRILNKLTQNEVAERNNISRVNYNRYELGKTKPDIETLTKLANFYHTTIDELVGKETNMINLNVLEEDSRYIVDNALKMTKSQKAQTINFIKSLLLFEKKD